MSTEDSTPDRDALPPLADRLKNALPPLADKGKNALPALGGPPLREYSDAPYSAVKQRS
jgi:hypothetical protein